MTYANDINDSFPLGREPINWDSCVEEVHLNLILMRDMVRVDFPPVNDVGGILIVCQELSPRAS